MYSRLFKTCEKINQCGYNSSMDKTPGEGRARRFHSDNSQAASRDQSEAEGHLVEHNGEFQHSPEKQTQSKKQSRRAGVLSRLRKTLNWHSGESFGSWSNSSVRAIDIDGVEVGRDGPLIEHKERTPYYRCVAYPPGCIPTEVMLKEEDEIEAFNSEPLNCSGLGESSTVIDGAKRTLEVRQHGERNKSKSIQENAALASNAQICEDSKPPKVLYNNWIDPEL